MTDGATGVIVNIGVASGGMRPDVVAERASAESGMRVPNPEVGVAAVARVLALEPRDPDCRSTVTGGINRPGYEESPAIAALFEHARSFAADIGFDLHDLETGGGSDGNFTAAIAPTLDGLGGDGAGRTSRSASCTELTCFRSPAPYSALETVPGGSRGGSRAKPR